MIGSSPAEDSPVSVTAGLGPASALPGVPLLPDGRSRCQVIHNLGWSSQCGAAASWLVSYGCEHEHVQPDLPVCDPDREVLLTWGAAEGVVCGPCSIAAEPHQCLVEFIRVVPLREDETCG